MISEHFCPPSLTIKLCLSFWRIRFGSWKITYIRIARFTVFVFIFFFVATCQTLFGEPILISLLPNISNRLLSIFRVWLCAELFHICLKLLCFPFIINLVICTIFKLIDSPLDERVSKGLIGSHSNLRVPFETSLRHIKRIRIYGQQKLNTLTSMKFTKSMSIVLIKLGNFFELGIPLLYFSNSMVGL